MEKGIYLGIFENREDVENNFNISLPKSVKIIVAAYEYEDYSGSALVVFEEKGRLYEVNGSHCSCFGLEDQWQPEKTNIETLFMREFVLSHSDFKSALEKWSEKKKQSKKRNKGIGNG